MEHEPTPADMERIGSQIVDGAFKVHRYLGPGLLESVYEECLACELRKRGLTVERQLSVPIVYDGVALESPLRLDLLVEGKVLIEDKAVEKMIPLYQAQALTYMKLADVRLAFLINFNVELIKEPPRYLVWVA